MKSRQISCFLSAAKIVLLTSQGNVHGRIAPVPPILDQELIDAVSALVRSADAYRVLLFKIADQALAKLDENESASHPAVVTLVENENVLNLADKVIDALRDQLGIDD